MVDATGEEGQTLELTADVTNADDTQQTKTVELVIDNGVGAVDSSTLTISPNTTVSEVLQWTTSIGDAGTYTATYQSPDDSASRDVEVVASPSVSTVGSSNIGSDSADVTGDLGDLGSASPVAVSVQFRETGMSTWQETASESKTATGQYTQTVSGLSSDTQHEFRAKADGDGVGTGAIQTFTTGAAPAGLTWQAASDWDNAVSDPGSVHESTADTDHDDATVVKKGYKAANPFNTGLQGYWPFHEDSGSTAHDFSGNNFDGSIGSNITIGQSGLLGTSAFKFPGGNPNRDITPDIVTIGNDSVFSNDAITVMWWVNLNELTTESGGIHKWQGGNEWGLDIDENGDGSYSPRFLINDGGTQIIKGTTTFNTGVWYHVAGVWNDGTMRIFVDGQEEDSLSGLGTIHKDTGDEVVIGANVGPVDNGKAVTNGRHAGVRYFTRALSQSEIQDLYGTVRNESTLTTATKSFSSTSQPDLQNLSYSLNGETITLDVIGSPGTASEETVIQTLGGASSYSLSWSNSHTDFRIKANLSTSDATTSPTLSSVTLR